MRQSNGYIIGFSAVLTIVLGGLLALAATKLKEPQRIQQELDTKKKILGAVMNIPEGVDVLDFYDKNIESMVVDTKGNLLEGVNAEDINVRKEYKKTNASDKRLPVFKFKSQVHEGQVEAYILPIYGNGLWDEIWGYIALADDFNSLKGAIFDHKAETPGLGARITDAEIQNRFKGKRISDADGNLVCVRMLKGEGNEVNATDYNVVDGLSGATMTSNGVNAMLESYVKLYSPFLQKEKQAVAKSLAGSSSKDLYNIKSSSDFIDYGVIGE
ncbi:MAG: NADH:ubiquinone reductase (Na(+)-transporting) subunit C [Cyclobacteriaceae bacterium]